MNYIRDIEFKHDNQYHAIIEIKKGSKDKNELVAPAFDKLEKVRKIKIAYPFYYGCFPQTLAGDGDPADAIIITTKKHKLLQTVHVQPIAVIKTIDKGEEDNKFICVEGSVKHIDKIINIIYKFLSIYKGKDADMIIDPKIGDASEAVKLLEEAHKAYAPAHATALKVE